MQQPMLDRIHNRLPNHYDRNQCHPFHRMTNVDCGNVQDSFAFDRPSMQCLLSQDKHVVHVDLYKETYHNQDLNHGGVEGKDER